MPDQIMKLVEKKKPTLNETLKGISNYYKDNKSLIKTGARFID